MTPTPCTSPTKAGGPCPRPAQRGSLTCFAHTPGAASAAGKTGGRRPEAARRASADAGALAGLLGDLKLESHEDCRRATEKVLQAMGTGLLSASAATAIAGVIRTAQRSIDDVLTARLERLEARLNLTPKA